MAGTGYRLLLAVILGILVFPALISADSEELETAPNPQVNGGGGSTDASSDDDDVVDPTELNFAKVYLQQYGYYDDDDDDNGGRRSMATQEKAIAALQFKAHIPITGRLNMATLKMMHRPRCGNKDYNGPADRLRRRRRRYSVATRGWSDNTVTYRLRNLTPDMRPWAVREEIRRAFNVWSQAANINFRETFGSANIIIRFAEGSHGDGYAFDGEGGILAHAFFPGGKPISGDAHFDDQEWFTANTSRGTNLFMVAAHELGHSLGLGHSDVEGSMMAPMYPGYMRGIGLHPDDVAGIRRLYGPRRPGTGPGVKPGPKPPPRPPVQPGTPTTPSCDLRVNAIVSTSQGDIFAFRNNELFHFRALRMLPGFPKQISQHFKMRRGSITSVDAGYQRHDGNIRLFSGNRYFDFTLNGHNVGSGTLQQLFRGVQRGSAPTRLDTAVKVPEFNNKVFLFRGMQYWRLNDYAGSTDFGYPRLISRWSGDLGSGFDATFYFEGSVYFVSGNTYQQYQWSEREVIPSPNGQPNRVDRQFYGCGQLHDGSGFYGPKNGQSSSRKIYNMALISAMFLLTTLATFW